MQKYNHTKLCPLNFSSEIIILDKIVNLNSQQYKTHYMASPMKITMLRVASLT